jgi:hypothetical protein
MAIAFLIVTSFVVGLRLYQRIYLSSGLHSDDYLIIFSYVSEAPVGIFSLKFGLLTDSSSSSAGYLAPSF